MPQEFMSAAELEAIDTEARVFNPQSAFLQIGGAKAAAEATELFYVRLLADRVCSPYFDELVKSHRMSGLKRHQVDMLATALGGGSRYDVSKLGPVHARVRNSRGEPITVPVYRRVSLHLVAVLHEVGVPMDILFAVDDALRGLESTIVPQPRLVWWRRALLRLARQPEGVHA